MWFRGNGRHYKIPLCPGVYREEFMKRAKQCNGKDDDEKRLYLEQRMLEEFSTTGAALLRASDMVNTYLAAQHFGMPTRLLDWTTNPLAALFFAVEKQEDHARAGEVYVMEAKKILPPVKEGVKGDEGLWVIVRLRHPYVVDAIGKSFGARRINLGRL